MQASNQGVRRGWRTRLPRFLVIGVLVGIALLGFAEFHRWSAKPDRLWGGLYAYELQLYDVLVRSFGVQQKIDGRLRIIGVDDSSLKVFGPWPWNRALHGQLVSELAKDKASVVSFDFLFDSDAPGTDAFTDALKAYGRGVIGSKITDYEGADDEDTRVIGDDEVMPLPALAEAASVGYINVDARDNLYSASLRYTALATRYKKKWIYSWDLLSYAHAMNVSPRDISVEAEGVRVGPHFIPTNPSHEILINYYKEESQSESYLEQIPFWRILGTPPPEGYVGAAMQTPAESLKDSVCLVGWWDLSTRGDMVETPLGRYAGIWVHAQIVNTLLTRQWMREAPPWTDYFLLLVLPLLLAWVFMRVNAIAVFLGSIGVVGTLGAITVAAFQHGWWVRALGPSVEIFATALVVVLYQFFRSHMLLRQFITPELAHDLLLAEGDNARTTEQDCTIIFSDIRGFTTLNEQMPPTKMVELLKEYHSLTVPIYEKHGGRCLDYLGDAQMVVYGDPMTLRRAKEKNHAVAACAAGLEVHDAIEEMNERWKQRGDPPFEVGIGCCSGVVAIGVLGADTAHLQYTVIGDVTNTAARVQGLSRDLRAPVICTQSTIDRTGDRIEAEMIKAVALKGKAREVTVYRILGLKGDTATIDRMRAQTREIVGTVLAMGLALFLLLASGCSPSPSPPAPPPASTATPAGPAPTAAIQPVGTPSAILTVKPSGRPQTESSGGPRVTYATPPPPPLTLPGAPVETATPTSPLMTASSTPDTRPLLDGLTFPIYPNATRKTQMRQDIPDAQHLIVVLSSSDSADTVKLWYAKQLKPNAIVDTGKDRDGDRKIEMSVSGGRVGDGKLLDTVVIQPEADGTCQIVLAQWIHK